MNNRIKIEQKKFDNILFFLLGLFSTMQIVTVFNVTLFLVISYITLIYMLITCKKVQIRDHIIVIYLATIVFSFVLNFCMSTLTSGYQIKSIMALINVIVIILIYIMSNNDRKKTMSFIKGFEWSCKIQLMWCVLQIVCNFFFDKDINNLIFNQILRMTENITQSREGKWVCTGLHWHAANLIPIIVYTYIFSKSLFFKIVSVIIVLFTQNTTSLLAIGLCIAADIFVIVCKVLKTRVKKIASMKLLFLLCAIFLFLCVMNKLWPYALNKIEQVVYRFTALSGNLKGGEGDVGVSSLTHLNYYILIPDIIMNNNFINALFGYGLECSGYIYSKMYGQYVGSVWVIESDIVNTLLNVGIIGFVIYYWIIYRIFFVVKANKNKNKYRLFIVVILLSGITYNIQFNWTFLLILMLYGLAQIDRKVNI